MTTKRARIPLLPCLGALLVLAALVLAVLSTLEPDTAPDLASARSHIAAGDLDAAVRILQSMRPTREAYGLERQRLLEEVEIIRSRRTSERREAGILAAAKQAVGEGRLEDAANALEGVGDAGDEARSEVGRALLERARRAAEEWDLTEARRLLEVSRRTWREPGEFEGEEIALRDRERRMEEGNHALAEGEQAFAAGDLDVARVHLERAIRVSPRPEALDAARLMLDQVITARSQLTDRESTRERADRLLAEGRVTEARELLTRYGRTMSDASFDHGIDVLRRLEESGGIEAYLPVRKALTYLADIQDPATGSFNVQKLKRERREFASEFRWSSSYETGLVGLTLLAFDAFRDFDLTGEFHLPAARAANWLIKKAGRTGSMNGNNYGEAIAALALSERILRVPDAKAEKVAAQKIVDYLTKSAPLPGGAWRYSRRNTEADTSVTCWVLQALEAARRAGLTVPDASLTDGLAFLDSCTGPEGHVGYTAVGKRPNLTYASLLVRRMLPELADEEITALNSSAVASLARPRLYRGETPLATADAAKALTKGLDYYGLYYLTYALHREGGDLWKLFGPAVETALRGAQRAEGKAEGSWPSDERWGKRAGVVYCTALSALTLEVYYRSRTE